MELNLIEILKDAPKDIPLYSTIFGNCRFAGISEGLILIKVCALNSPDFETLRYFSDGRFYKRGECTLFPSFSNRDWSTFKVPNKHKHFEPLQLVLVKESLTLRKIWRLDMYSHFDEELGLYISMSGHFFGANQIIPYEGNEDKLGKLVE